MRHREAVSLSFEVSIAPIVLRAVQSLIDAMQTVEMDFAGKQRSDAQALSVLFRLYIERVRRGLPHRR